jgi:chromosome segregation ATPase
LEQSQLQLHQTHDDLEQSQLQMHQTQDDLEQSQLQVHQTQSELEQSQSQLHQTQSELEQSQLQLHQTQSELEQSQSQLYQTQSELEQSQSQLHQIRGDFQESQAQLDRIKGELKTSHSSQSTPSQVGQQSQGTQYDLLIWEAWHASHNGDLKQMEQYLRQSLKHTPFSRTQTILNWLEKFASFSSQKGENFDTNFLTNTLEWKELMRGILAIKSAGTTY